MVFDTKVNVSYISKKVCLDVKFKRKCQSLIVRALSHSPVLKFLSLGPIVICCSSRIPGSMKKVLRPQEGAVLGFCPAQEWSSRVWWRVLAEERESCGRDQKHQEGF